MLCLYSVLYSIIGWTAQIGACCNYLHEVIQQVLSEYLPGREARRQNHLYKCWNLDYKSFSCPPLVLI